MTTWPQNEQVMTKWTRNNFSINFKTRVVLEAIQGVTPRSSRQMEERVAGTGIELVWFQTGYKTSWTDCWFRKALYRNCPVKGRVGLKKVWTCPVLTNQVWSIDITYICPQRALCIWWQSLTGIPGMYSSGGYRPWLKAPSVLAEALRKYRRPSIFNTDQGAQFTSAAFIGALTEHLSISISLDGCGRASNIRIFIWKGTLPQHAELLCGFKENFVLFNVERPHQSLVYSTR